MEHEWSNIRINLIVDKTKDNRLKWFGHVSRKEKAEVVGLVKEM